MSGFKNKNIGKLNWDWLFIAWIYSLLFWHAFKIEKEENKGGTDFVRPYNIAFLYDSDIQCVIVLNAVKLFHIVFLLHRTMYYFINADSLHFFGIRGGVS